MIEHIAQERLLFEQQRRLAYRISGSLGMLLLLYAQISLQYDTSIDDLKRYIFFVNHVVLAGFTWWILWVLAKNWFTIEFIERIVFWFLSFEAIVFNSVIPSILGQSIAVLVQETVGDDIWFLLVVCSLAIHLYSGRKGIILAVGLYLITFSIAMTTVLLDHLGGNADPDGLLIIQIYVAAGMLLGFLFILARYRDHTHHLHVEYKLLEEIAFTDMLTQLPNRTMGQQHLQKQIAFAERSDLPLSVVLWDIDHFKQINDRYGHHVGDQVLQSISSRLGHELRLSDMLVRWGGEEFLIILPNTILSAAIQIAERLCLSLSTTPLVNHLTITASFGVSCYQHGDTLEQLLQRADAALYQAKAQGRNRVVTSARDLARWRDADKGATP